MLLCLCLLLLGTPVAAQVETASDRGQAVTFDKGTVEVGGVAGASLPVTWLHAHADRSITMASLNIGRLLTHRVGLGPLAGYFEMLLEVSPLISLRQPAHALGLTASPLHLRWNFAALANPRLRPFAEGSGGIVFTNQAVPVRTTSFNFIE